MFTYTPLGWLLLIGSILTLVAIVRSAIVPAHSAANIRLIHQNPSEKLPKKSVSDWNDLLTLVIFIVLMYGIVERSWLGIFPRLASLIGTPVSLADRVTTALSIGLLAGAVAFVAAWTAEGLQSSKGSFPASGS